jgi:hypothetical protein
MAAGAVFRHLAHVGAHLVACRPKLAEVGLRATRFGGRPSAIIGSEGWAHFEFTRISIEPIILRKKIEELRIAGAFRGASSCRNLRESPERSARG